MPDLHILNISQSLRRRHERKNLKHHIIHHLPRPYIPRYQRRDDSRRELDVAYRHHDPRGHQEDDVDCDGEDQAVPWESGVVDVEEGDAEAKDGEEDAEVPPHGDLFVFLH